ncbi:hypothetical protein HY991_01080 [Candidatus Micrarchaeota archaeon]|nr:hypothetical protein [Candidatus Micrarchaeota archaeon]
MPVLEGGRKPIRVKRIMQGQLLGWGAEGNVSEVKVKLAAREKQRELALAEKEFNPNANVHEGYPFWNPEYQFKAMRKLQALNREKKLGLRIVPTIRLRRREGAAPTLLTTRLPRVTMADLTREQMRQFMQDVRRQQKTIERVGFKADFDSFMPQIGKDGKAIAVLFDFGNVFDRSLTTAARNSIISRIKNKLGFKQGSR